MNTTQIISKLHLYHFRGLNDLTLDNLSQVNVLVGVNNSGKTSVLEAIHLLRNPSNIGLLIKLSGLRARVSEEAKQKNRVRYLLSMFQRVEDSGADTPHYRIELGAQMPDASRRYEADGTIEELTDLAGVEQQVFDVTVTAERDPQADNGQGREVRKWQAQIVNGEDKQLVGLEKNLYRSLYVHSSVNPYLTSVQFLTDYIIRERKDTILNMLQAFDPTVDDFSIVGEDIYLHNAASGALPLFAYGSGMQKAVSLTALIAYCRNGVLLIDEIDNTIHKSAFEDVFRWFFRACKEHGVQTFVTTHSAEALDAILRVGQEDYSNDDFLRVITLRRDYSSQKTWCRVRTGEEALADREQFGMELRV